MEAIVLKTKDGKQLRLKLEKKSTVNASLLTQLKQGDVVILSLKSTSKYFHPFLQKIETTIQSATDKQITIMSPIKNSIEKAWIIDIDDVEQLLLKVDNEKSNSN